MIDSIRITHGELECGTYRILADFFRTAGIHVCGCISGRSDETDEYDIRFRVTAKEAGERIEAREHVEAIDCVEAGRHVEVKEHNEAGDCVEAIDHVEAGGPAETEEYIETGERVEEGKHVVEIKHVEAEEPDSVESSDEIEISEIADKESFEEDFFVSSDNGNVPEETVREKYKEYVENYLQDCLRKMNQTLSEKEQKQAANDFEVLKVLARVFVRHDLLMHFNAYTVLYNDEPTVKEAQSAFAAAYKDLRNYLEGFSDSKYAIYAEMNIAKWINETCVFLGQRLIFDTEKCMEGLDRALVIDPGFTSVYVLKAYMTEIDSDYDNLSEAYYRKALDCIDSEHCKSYPCYRIGRYFEKKKKDSFSAILYYRKSYGMNHSEYRAIYKIALSQESQKDYLLAAESCNEICRILQAKEAVNYLQPREYEYLFKAYNERARIYGTLYRDSKAYRLARNNLRRVCDSIRQVNPMYKLIFGDRAAEFAERTYNWLERCRHY